MNTKNKGKICSVESCESPAEVMGMCKPCYHREVAYPKTKANRQARKELDPAAVAPPSTDIDAMLTPVYANIKYLKTRQRDITKWLNVLNLIAKHLESVR